MARRRKAGTRSLIDDVWRASRGGIVAVLFFSTFVNILKFASPLYLLQILERVPASRSVETLVMLTIIALLAVGTGYLLDVIRTRMLNKWSVWIEATLGPEILRRGTGRGTSRTERNTDQAFFDLGTVSRFVGGILVRWIDLVWAPVFVFGVYLIHPIMGHVALCAALVLVGLGVLQDYMTSSSRKAANAARRDGDALIRTMERNRETVDALQLGDNLTALWRRNEAGRLDERQRTATRNDTFRLVMAGLGQFLRIGLLAVGIWLVVLDQLSIGSIFAARIMAGFGFRLVEGAVRNWRASREARIAYRRLCSHFEPEDEATVSVASRIGRAPLVLSELSHRYPYQRDYLFRRLSLRIETGEVVLIFGPAGSGKSTLSRIIVGLAAPKYGTARLGDLDLTRLPPDHRAKLIGYMPQHTELFDGTICENISRMGQAPLDEVIAVAKLIGIHDFIVALPHGYDTPIGPDSGGVLSGSQRKRIGLARAFFGNPSVIVLDEPSANLDAPSRRRMEQAIQTRKAEGTRIVVTQAVNSQRLTRIADRLVDLSGAAVEIEELAKGTRRKSAPRTNLRRVK